MSASAELARRAEAVRRFNRFYTRQIGVLNEGLLRSPFSLAESRVIYELAHRERTTAAELSAELGLDPGYLSRILRGFKKNGLVTTQPSPSDGRRSLLQLTEQGQQAFAMLNGRSHQEFEALLGRLAPDTQERLVAAMSLIEELLSAQPERAAPYILRPHRPGDMGWVVHRHGVLYAEEYGWDERFEALVASIVAGFIEHYDPKRERSARIVLTCARTQSSLSVKLRKPGGAGSQPARKCGGSWASMAEMAPAMSIGVGPRGPTARLARKAKLVA